ncbi:hypothetical protein BpHYR1_050120 [Brachionus plicatilis]|uniref:Uncharacterized protein n=1 Tax=Brachionus plicatilis TaxID=10195 RepID=A0A3M7RCJ4_BRAPC|nr:hypothetical protein BpHYR1_050120 [Brachionus plicatilis]
MIYPIRNQKEPLCIGEVALDSFERRSAFFYARMLRIFFSSSSSSSSVNCCTAKKIAIPTPVWRLAH